MVHSARPSLLTGVVVRFLKTVAPFHFLPEFELEAVARKVSLEYFPKDTVILAAGGKSSELLYVVHKGGVRLTAPTDAVEPAVLDLRGEGEIFGLLSLLGGDHARLDVTAIEDTLCYSIPAEEVRRLISAYSDFSAYLLRTSVTRYVDSSLSEVRARTRLLDQGELLLYSVPVSEAAMRAAVVCTAQASVQQAAQRMTAGGATCIFVLDDNRPVGIVTEKDFAEKVVARNLSTDAPVTLIMSSPVISVDTQGRVFEVLILMLGHDIHHVLVTSGNEVKGVITYHDLMLLQSKSPLSIARHLEQQKTLDDLVVAHPAVNRVIPLLLREGARASHITRVLSEINDRVAARILELAETHVGPPPVPYCWTTFGSEGRREQTFKTDQDNGLIYADDVDENPLLVQQYFAELARFGIDALLRCGYPRCTGDYMATNPRWRQPLTQWRSYYDAWIAEPTLRSTESALILLDIRAVAGSKPIVAQMREYVHAQAAHAGFFKSILAYLSLQQKPPLGFFHNIVVERGGEHKDELDLKMFGTLPIVNAARLFALDAGIEHTSTFDRIQALEQSDFLQQAALWRDLTESFEFLMMVRLQRQLAQMEANQPLSNHVDPASLSNLQKQMLKEVFHTIARVQALVDSRFRSAVWSQLEMR